MPSPDQHPDQATIQMDPVYLMGVSGCGKTVIGSQLAEKLGGTFIDGDDLHPATNKEKMAAGIALNDEDRYPWFEAIHQSISNTEQRPVIVACSALKRYYRDLLREGFQHAVFVYLEGDFDLIMSRIQKRDHEYMPSGLLRSQFETLEVPAGDERVITVNIEGSVNDITEQLCASLAKP